MRIYPEELKKLLIEDTKDLQLENKDAYIEKFLEKHQHYLRKLSEYKENEIKRTRVYKELLKKLRKQLYYHKRTFYPEEHTHVSLEERGEAIYQLIKEISDVMNKYKAYTIADYGCGLFPLTIPEWSVKPEVYYAIDNNKKIIEKLLKEQAWLSSYTKLYIIKGDLRYESPNKILMKTNTKRTDLSLYNRVLHTLYRHTRKNLVELLEDTPSDLIIITEPRTSLIKKYDITKREARFIEQVIKKALELGVIARYEIKILQQDILALLNK